MIVQRTELADLMIEVRGIKNQTDFQHELEALAGLSDDALGSKYVSLVETGVRKKLSPEFLRAMELKTGKPQAELEAMNRRFSGKADRRAGRTVRIVAGHTAYAAGLIGAALKGTSGVDLATCAEQRDSQLTNWQPNAENARWISFREGGISPLKDEKFLAEVADERRTRYFSANDALDALDAGWADVAAIPSALVEGRRSYLRLLRLVASDAACMLICGGRLAKVLLPEATRPENGGDRSEVDKGWEKPNDIPVFDMTTRDFARRITDLLRRNESVKSKSSSGSAVESIYRIGAEPRTIAEVVLDETAGLACSSRYYVKVSASDILVPIASHNAATFDSTSLDALRLKAAAKDEPELDGVLIWEPHASWIIERLKERGAAPHALISLSRSADEVTHRPRRFEFDLVTNAANSTDTDLLRAVRDLMFRIWDVSEELSMFRPTMYHGLVNALATYFKLGEPLDSATTRRSSRVLGAVAYDVGPKLEAMPLFESVAD